MVNAPLLGVFLYTHVPRDWFYSHFPYLCLKFSNLFIFFPILSQKRINRLELIAGVPLAFLNVLKTIIQLILEFISFLLAVIIFEKPFDHVSHLVFVFIVHHQHVVIVTPGLESQEMLFLVEDQF